MSSSYELFKESRVIGTGSGTYSQIINNYKFEDDNNSFTNFAPNGYTQLLIEQGIIGFSLWGALFIIAIIMALRKHKYSSVAAITLIIICIVLIREISFPVILTSSGFQLVIFTVLAVFLNTLSYETARKEIKYLRYFPRCILSITLLICGYSIYYTIDEQNNRKALSMIESGGFKNAEKYISETSEHIPYLINRGIIEIELYKETKDVLYLKNAENHLKKAALKNPNDNMIKYYLSIILRKNGDDETALHILKELAYKFPNKSQYQFGVFDIMYKNRQTDASFSHLLQAVKLSPNLLDNLYLKEMLSKNEKLDEKLKNALLLDISNGKSIEDPVFLAKSGKILLSLDCEQEAKQYLEKVTQLLPNLIYPYYYLSQIETKRGNPAQGEIYLKQFVFLLTGNLSKDFIDKIVYSGEIEELINKNKDFIDDYYVKFKTWYHSSTTLKQIIL
jgi:hypothetical protein